MNQIKRKGFPRLPLDGRLDLTYRCSNNCRHCWLWVPDNAIEKQQELSFDEIRRIVEEARQMGTQSWAISGGEPMLRPDFVDIFDFITQKSVSYKLNTNGTLITPKIAELMTRKGNNMVALYGATAEVHDYVTRTPGSYAATRRGFAYLKEAGARFTVQLVPMRANYHQFQDMIDLAQSLSEDVRVGAAWLWLSADHSEVRNREILRQRLDPTEVLKIDSPGSTSHSLSPVAWGGRVAEEAECGISPSEDFLLASCIAARRDFHIDPYGGMSFCYYIKDPALRYDLRKGTFREAWEEFIPSLTKAIPTNKEYEENCGSCDLRQDCRWCPVFGYLEHGRYTAKVDYLCQVAAEARRYKEEWRSSHIRYYKIAGITIQVSADFPITDETFDQKFSKFQVAEPGDDTIALRLVTGVPKLSELRLGQEIYRKIPWAIYRNRNAWVYRGISSEDDNQDPRTLAIINQDYSQMTVYRDSQFFSYRHLNALTTFVSDQILLSQVLADRQACYLHSSAIILDGRGYLFVGHSEAGKSTMLKMLTGQGEILCDDRNIIRLWPDGFRVHGTWSHGELPDVSPASAPLRAILYLEKAPTNELVQIIDYQERLGRLLSHVVKALVTEDWWEKTLNLAGKIAHEVPAYGLKFDKSGEVVETLKQLD